MVCVSDEVFLKLPSLAICPGCVRECVGVSCRQSIMCGPGHICILTTKKQNPQKNTESTITVGKESGGKTHLSSSLVHYFTEEAV